MHIQSRGTFRPSAREQKYLMDYKRSYKGPGKRGHIVADTLLPTQVFSRLPARATFVADTNFVSGTQKMFLILFRNILSATNVSQFAQPNKHHEQQCVRNNVSSFASTLTNLNSCKYTSNLFLLSNTKHTILNLEVVLGLKKLNEVVGLLYLMSDCLNFVSFCV